MAPTLFSSGMDTPDRGLWYEDRVILISAFVSLAGFLYGLDIGSISVIIQMTQFHNSIGPLTLLKQGIYVSLVLLASGLCSLASTHFPFRPAQKPGIVLWAALSLIGNVISICSPVFASLIVARLVTGVGLSRAWTLSHVYLTEIASQKLEHTMTYTLQSFMAFGIISGYFIAFGSHHISGDLSWKLPFIIQAIIAGVLAVGTLYLPLSPRHLVQTGRRDEALRVLRWLRPPDEIDESMDEIRDSLNPEDERRTSNFKTIVSRRYRYRTALTIFLASFRQLTGIDVVQYYAPVLFRQARFTSEGATFLASGVMGALMLACIVPAQIWGHRWGRRGFLCFGGAAMALSWIIIGSLYAAYGHTTADGVVLTSKPAQWVVSVLIYISAASFSCSWAVVGNTYANEIIPLRLRAKVETVKLPTTYAVSFVLTLMGPLFLNSTPSGPYFLFGFSTMIAVVACILLPETKDQAEAQVNAFFGNREEQIELMHLPRVHRRA